MPPKKAACGCRSRLTSKTTRRGPDPNCPACGGTGLMDFIPEVEPVNVEPLEAGTETMFEGEFDFGDED